MEIVETTNCIGHDVEFMCPICKKKVWFGYVDEYENIVVCMECEEAGREEVEYKMDKTMREWWGEFY